MTWEHAEAPDATATVSKEGNILTWSAVTTGESYTLYNIYASKTTPVNTADARNLVATRVMDTTWQADPSMHYAVTAIDRYGNEGPARQDVATSAEIDLPSTTQAPNVELLHSDGNYLTIPSGHENDSYLAVETMQGTIIATYPNTRRLDISKLPKGFYLLKTLQEQGIARRVGYFMK